MMEKDNLAVAKDSIQDEFERLQVLCSLTISNHTPFSMAQF